METVFDAVRQLRPPTSYPTSDQHVRQSRALLNYITAHPEAVRPGGSETPSATDPLTPARRPRKRARRLVLSGAVGAGLATMAIVLSLVVPQSRPSKAAAAELNDLASTALVQSNPIPAAGESLYSKQTGEVSESFSQVNGVSTPAAEATFAVTLDMGTE